MKREKIWIKLFAILLVFSLSMSLVAGAASTYVVKSGDVLWKIAKESGMTWQNLAKINNLKNPNALKVGQILLLEEEKTPATPATPAVPVTPTGDGKLTEGTYEGIGSGFGGALKVAVTVKGGKLTEVKVLSHAETLPGGVSEMPAKIMEKGLKADIVAGCTVSSKAILAAVQEALDKAAGKTTEVKLLANPDVVVVGGGLAGMSAAYFAAKEGAKVILFEKSPALGGTFGGGTWIGTGISMQFENGIYDDSPAKLMEDFDRLNKGYQERTGITDYWWNKELGKYFAITCGPLTYFMEELGTDFGKRIPENPTLYEPHNTKRVVSGNRKSYTDVIEKELNTLVAEGKLSIALNSNVEDIIMDGKAVVGVKAMGTDGKQKDYRAKSIVLATGGYAHNEKLVALAGLKNYTTVTPAFQTGDGLVWAEKAGGILKNMDYMTVYAGGMKLPETGINRGPSIRVKEFGDIIFVNTDGKRFVDEYGPGDGTTYDAITMEWKTQKDNKVYVIASQAQVDKMKANKRTLISGDKDWTIFETQLKNGNVVWSGDDAAAAAKAAGINAANFVETLKKYNGFVASGKDTDFGRTNRLSPEAKKNRPNDPTFSKLEGKIYIVETTPYTMITAGGPDMNAKGQIVNASREPVLGLYQAGEMVGLANAFGRTMIGGIGNTGNLVWGKLAGENAAQYALGK